MARGARLNAPPMSPEAQAYDQQVRDQAAERVRSIASQQAPIPQYAHAAYLGGGLADWASGQPDPTWAGQATMTGYTPGGQSPASSPYAGGTMWDSPTGASASGGSGAGFFSDLTNIFGNPAAQANDPVSNPPVWFQPQQYIPPTLHDQGMQMAPMMNNWLMGGFFNALPNAVQATNDAWAQQSNINARNSLLQQMLQMFGNFGNNQGGGFHDTASRQRAGGGTYTTSVDAGGLNPNEATAAVNALNNSHPNTNTQHGDLRRTLASQSANNLNRGLSQMYANQQGNMEAARASEGQGLASWNANNNLRKNAQQMQVWNSVLGAFANPRLR